MNHDAKGLLAQALVALREAQRHLGHAYAAEPERAELCQARRVVNALTIALAHGCQDDRHLVGPIGVLFDSANHTYNPKGHPDLC